ncbi:MAG: BamA/TamA family outer membrane protein [Cyanobacteriota bacterium]|nr:BamA/TamA family outer membrane protein [Cyanobacteriota bacterium]
MRLSPQFLVILATSGVIGLGPGATATHANPAPAVPPQPTEASSTRADSLVSPAGAEALLVSTTAPPQALVTPGSAPSSAQGAPSPLAPHSPSLGLDLQAVMQEYQAALRESHAPLSTEPTAQADQDQPALALKAQPESLAQSTPGGRQISPEEAQQILQRAVERRQGVESEMPPASTETETPPTTPEPAPTAQPEPEPEPRVLVAEVLVQASTGDLAPDLRDLVYSVVQTRAGRTATRSQLQADINAIFATGFFADVKANPVDTDLGVQVNFIVQPNPVLTDVRLVGNQVLPQTEADRIFADQKGKIINLLDFQNGILAINQWYQDNGYVLGQVVASPQVGGDGVVTLEVAEGVIESIEVRFFNDQGESVDEQGQPLRGYTHEYIITREFQTQPGDVFNQAQIEQDFQRVFGLQIFEDITPGLEPGSQDPRRVKVIVNATERSTGSVAAGLGFNFTGDIFGTVSYRQDNFGGNNQKLTAEAQVSTRDLLFDVSFTDPWIAGDPFRTSYTATTFARRAINLNFDGGPNEINLSNGDRVRIRRLGAGVTFSRPLDNGWTVAVGTLAQNISSRDSGGALFTTDAAGNPLTASNAGVDDLWTFPLSATWDQRNDNFNPTSGGILRLNSEQSVPVGRGSILMNRLRASYSHYLPLRLINFTEGPQALAFNVQLGTILGDVPPYEAFSLGGTNSIRGYDEGEAGSGRSYAQFSAEYRFPVFSFLGMALFFDAGSDLGSGGAVPGAPGPSRGKPGGGFGYGAGVRVQTPLGPLRIDYGFNDDGQGRLHFGIGERF